MATSGTNVDTVLAAYTGTALSGLTRVAFNDDGGGAENDPIGPSELVL